MVKVRFKTRANVVFNENEIVYVNEDRVVDIAGVVVVEHETEKKKKEVN